MLGQHLANKLIQIKLCVDLVFRYTDVRLKQNTFNKPKNNAVSLNLSHKPGPTER